MSDNRHCYIPRGAPQLTLSLHDKIVIRSPLSLKACYSHHCRADACRSTLSVIASSGGVT